MSAIPATTIVPAVHAVIPILENVLDRVSSLYDEDFLNLPAVRSLVEDKNVVRLARLDDPKDPLIKIDAKGNKTLIQMWGHPKSFFDTDFTVALLCPLTRNPQGREMYKPEALIRGTKANVLIVGGMSCCGGALQTHWSHVLPDGQAIDDALIPEADLAHPEHARWLKGRVFVADTPGAKSDLAHMLQDLMAHRLPDDPRFKHVCSSTPDYLGKPSYSLKSGPV